MATGLPENYHLSSRARSFYSRSFEPAFATLQSAISHTPLVIMLWGPRHRTREWTRRRLLIREMLEQRGHTAFLSEQLGVPIDAGLKKGVEFLQSEVSDVIVAIQPLYAVVGNVRHFVEYRVVDAKMLLFIAENAADQHVYARAVAELRTNYNNVHTYRFPEDPAQVTLVDKILAQVRVLQMVKYRAIQSGRNWGLGSESYRALPGQPSGPARAFHHNLLELYREHRTEIDVMAQPGSLFLLSFVRQAEKMTADELQRHTGVPQAELFKEIGRLERADLLAQTDGKLVVSGVGCRFLDTIGLIPPARPAPAPVWRPSRWQVTAALSGAAGTALAGLILASLVVLNGANVVSNRQPLELTPEPTLSAPAKSILPAPSATLPSSHATPVPTKR